MTHSDVIIVVQVTSPYMLHQEATEIRVNKCLSTQLLLYIIIHYYRFLSPPTEIYAVHCLLLGWGHPKSEFKNDFCSAVLQSRNWSQSGKKTSKVQ